MPSIRTRTAKGSPLSFSELETTWKRPSVGKTAAYTTDASNNRDTIEVTGGDAVTITLGVAATVIAACETTDYEVTIRNSSTAMVTVAPTGTDQIDGVNASTKIPPRRSKTFKINAAGTAYITNRSNDEFPSGTKLVFYQAAAPTGWTQDLSHNDKALRVVAAAGAGFGGTHALSSPPSLAHTHSQPSHTHDLSNHTHAGPSHSHTYSTVIAHSHTFTTSTDGDHTHTVGANTASGSADAAVRSGTPGINPTMPTSSGGAHSHSGTTASAGSASASTDAAGTGATGAPSVNATSAAGADVTGSTAPTSFAPQYIDVIVCSKD